MSYMLYDRRSSRTGRALRRALGLRGGMPSHFERHPENDFLIRWGSTAGEDARITINPRQCVVRAANKLLSLQVLREAGVLVPDHSEVPFELEYPMLGRSRTHHGGTDIVVYTEQTTGMLGRHHFFTQFVPSTHEMRIHIAGGEMIRAQVKRGENEPEIPIRNHAQGYSFAPYTHTQPHERRVEAARRAVAALELDFGAVDLLAGTDGETYVLEVNTGVGCCRPTGMIYMDALHRIARERGVELRRDERHLDVLSPDEDE